MFVSEGGTVAVKAVEEPSTRALVVAAHPDDPEFGCAATMTKWAGEGREVTYLLLTSGDKGSTDPSMRPGEMATLREREQLEAAQELGIKEVLFQRHPDGLLENTIALRREITGIIRRLRPHTVVTIDPWRHYQTHPDHRAAGEAAVDAVYSAKQHYLFPEQLVAGIDPWRVKEVYLFWSDNPDVWEDVSGSIERRIAALSRHTSQVGEDTTALAERIRKGSREAGEKSGKGFPFAEGFKLLRM
jgi:LmbE family N-acetylglucosaminyl deacetylase